jgi:hypothetical protein
VEWLRLLDLRYPKGINPWHDLYTSAETAKVAKILKIADGTKIHELRVQLAEVAEAADNFVAVFGGVASRTDKNDWLKKTRSYLAKSISTLDGAAAHIPEGYSISPAKIDHIRQQLIEFHNVLDSTKTAPSPKRKATMRADLLVFLIDRLVGVFLQYRNARDITRANDNVVVYGEFPDFIRTAAKPYLKMHLPDYNDKGSRYQDLNRQIQDAVPRLKNRMNKMP